MIKRIILAAAIAAQLASGAVGQTYQVLQRSYFDNSGNLDITTGAQINIGTGASINSVDPQVVIVRDVDDTGSGNAHAFSDSSDITRTGTIGYNSFDARVDLLGTTDYDHYAAFQANPVFNFTGTISNNYGFYTKPTVTSGTVTNNYGAYVNNPTGTVVNNYGIYLVQQTAGSSSNWGLYTDNNVNYLGGSATGAELLPLQLVNHHSADSTSVGIDFRVIDAGSTATGKITNRRDGSGSYSMRFYTFGGSGLAEAATLDKDGNLSVVGTVDAGSTVSAVATNALHIGGAQLNEIGDAQSFRSVQGVRTSNATLTNCDLSVELPDDRVTVGTATIRVIAVRDGSADGNNDADYSQASWSSTIGFYWDGTNGYFYDSIGASTKTTAPTRNLTLIRDDITVGATPHIAINTGSLRVKVTGVAATTINWVAEIEAVMTRVD